jgi:hypothetical protein
MAARIIDRRTDHRLALAAAVGGMALASVFSLVAGRGIVVGLGFLAASIAPFLFRDSRPRPAGDLLERLRPEDVRGLSLVRASLGWSLAVQRKDDGQVVFVELENRADARRLVGRLRAGRKEVDGVTVEGELPWIAAVHAIGGAIAVVNVLQQAGHGYFGKALMTTGLVTLLTFIRIYVTRPGARALFIRSTPYGAHALLHVHGKRVNLAAFEREPDSPGATLARGNLSAREWLARIDELAAPAGGAYRDPVDEPTLRALVVDESADIDRRMGAARILKKRVGVILVDAIDDVEVRARIRIATADDEDAAEQIERAEPLYRSRRRSGG